MRDFSTDGIDFRSDTITQAVDGMRQAMANAAVETMFWEMTPLSLN